MPRKPTVEKPSAKRTSRAGIKVDKAVESSASANKLPRQPRLRQTPPRRTQPKPKALKKDTLKGARLSETEFRRDRAEAMKESLEHARATGMLPHEWMLAVMRGEQINHFAYDAESQEIIEVIVLPTFADRMEMAKSAAPYFANKLQPEKHAPGTGFADPAKQPGVMEVPLVDSMQQWAEMAQKSQTVLKKKVKD